MLPNLRNFRVKRRRRQLKPKRRLRARTRVRRHPNSMLLHFSPKRNKKNNRSFKQNRKG